ncbi:putative LTP1-protein-tyrosine-phosphatase [Mrakia frigida]|uniref:tyrosine protein phosphatase LTP1 n=1 Tax=Mrakia frigida TaxID=29902 RepID=UPI003FCC15CD
MSPSSNEIAVLFVCLGNICRSPMAEAVFDSEAKKRGLSIKVDSAGTGGYHVGDDPDPRTVATCQKHSVPISSHARQVSTPDYTSFHTIFAMDEQNLKNLERGRPRGSTAKVMLFSAYGDKKSITDPYYGGGAGFERAYQQCVRYSREFLDVLAREGLVGGGDGSKIDA